MILRGKTEEEIDAYYNKLEELAKPGGYETLRELCVNLKHLYPNHPSIDIADKGLHESIAINYVIVPFRRVRQYIAKYLRNHTPWSSIELTEECHPQLDLDTIFCCLKDLSVENCQQVLRKIKCSYNERQAVLNVLKNNDTEEFKRIVGDFENTEVLSDICWQMKLYEPKFEKKSYWDLIEDDILEAKSNGTYFEENGAGFIEAEEETPEEQFITILEYLKTEYLDYLGGRLKMESSEDYTVREQKIIQSIIDRPEGKELDERYKRFKANQKELNKRDLGPDVTETISKGKEDNHPCTKSNAGAPKKSWLPGWSEEAIRQKVQPIQSSVVGELEDFSFGDKSDTEKAAAVRAAGAAIVVYCSYALGVTKEKKYNAPAERILEAPRSSVNGYLRRLYEWYDTLIELGKDYRNAKKVQTLPFRWKKEDGIRAVFILDNINELTRLINNTKFAFGKEFGIETGLKYIPKREKSDAALGGAIEYNDGVKLNDDGSVAKTGIKLSDSSDN